MTRVISLSRTPPAITSTTFQWGIHLEIPIGITQVYNEAGWRGFNGNYSSSSYTFYFYEQGWVMSAEEDDGIKITGVKAGIWLPAVLEVPEYHGFYNISEIGKSTLTPGSFAHFTGSKIIIPTSISRVDLSMFPSYVDIQWIEGIEFNETELIRYFGTETEYTIPSFITSIAENAFANNTQLRQINIPSSVKYIGDKAFFGNTNLKSVTMNSNSQLTNIGYAAFQGCASLLTVNLELCTNLKSIGENAFRGCTNLYSIAIPYSVNSVGSSIFWGWTANQIIYVQGSYANWYSMWDYNCSAEIILPTNGHTNGLYFGPIYKDNVIIGYYVSAGDNFNDNNTNVVIPATYNGKPVTTIAADAFYLSKIKSVLIPASVTNIEERAFAWCYNLATVTFKQNSQLISIEDHAFFSCSKLISITFPGTITYLGSYAFGHNNALEQVVFEQNSQLNSIGTGLFTDSRSLKDINLPKSITSIGEFAFYYSGLINISIPSGVKTIGEGAFSYCENLNSIIIPSSVKRIGIRAFSGTGIYNNAENDSIVYADDWIVGYKGKLPRTFSVFEGTKGILDGAFNYLETSSILVPKGIYIGDSVFESCNKLTIYTQESANSSYWNANSNPSKRPIFWDCIFSADKTYVVSIVKSANSISNVNSTDEIFDQHRLYYYFIGWFSNTECTGSYYSSNELVSAPNQKYYTKWAHAYEGGSGTKDDPFMIGVAEHLWYMASEIVLEQKVQACYILTNNIYLNDTSNWMNWGDQAPANIWIPMGTKDRPFNGSFDGKGFSIRGIYVAESERNGGLFGEIKHANITNLRIEESYIKCKLYAGGIAGTAAFSSITNCYNSATIIGGSCSGGIVGFITRESQIINNCNVGLINGNPYFNGGIFGAAMGALNTIEYNYYSSHPFGKIGDSISKDYPLNRTFGKEGVLYFPIAIDGITNNNVLSALNMYVNAISLHPEVEHSNWEEIFYPTFEPQDYYSEGLRFSLINWGTEYNVSKGTASGEISIPSTYNGLPVTEISGFSYSWDVTKISIPSSIRWYIDSNKFRNCYALTDVYFFDDNSRIKQINSGAFYGCENLKTVSLPSSLRYICSNAFEGCTSLENVSFGANSNLNVIGDNAFKNCTSLTSITIPTAANYIGYGAFEGCTNFKSIIIPEGVNYVREDAFLGWTSIQKIYVFENNTDNWNPAWNRNCQAVIKDISEYSIDLNDLSWAEIAAKSANNKASDYFKIGDKKDVVLSTGEVITLVILGFNHDTKSTGGLAGITFGLEKCLSNITYKMNTSNVNRGSWGSSGMRSWLNSTIFSLLPQDLQNVIKLVVKETTAGHLSSSIDESDDKLFLFSRREVNGNNEEGYIGEGEMYDYWKTNSLPSGRWFLRSPTVKSSMHFRTVSGYSFASSSQSIMFGFCV